MASTQCHTAPRPIYSTIHKLFSEKFNSYWAVGVHVTAPVPWLIVVQVVLWVINTLHDPGSPYGIHLSLVPSMLATHGIGTMSATLHMYSWICVSVPCLPSPMAIGESTIPWPYALVPMEIGEPYAPTVDNCIIYACCSSYPLQSCQSYLLWLLIIPSS